MGMRTLAIIIYILATALIAAGAIYLLHNIGATATILGCLLLFWLGYDRIHIAARLGLFADEDIVDSEDAV